MRRFGTVLLSLAFGLIGTSASAEPITLDAVVMPKDQIRLDFKDDENHFLMLTQREGKAAGDGIFAGAAVAEYGMHDVTRGQGGKASGYLVATTSEGDVAYFHWRLRALFVAGPDGKAKVIDNGLWELAGGTGRFESMRGVGTLVLEFVSKTDRRYLLQGDISPAP